MKLLSFSLLAGLCLSPLAAQAAVIDFDAYSPGTILTNQYAAQGVTFAGNALVYSQSPYYISPVNGLAAGASVFSAVFAWDVNYVAAYFLDSEGGSNVGAMYAYDVNNILLGSATATTPGAMSTTNFAPVLLQLTLPGIHRVDFLAPDDGAVVDNLTFRPDSVPEPETLALLGLGLAGLAASRRKAA